MVQPMMPSPNMTLDWVSAGLVSTEKMQDAAAVLPLVLLVPMGMWWSSSVAI